ncbi:enolase 4 [Gastrophryne carolinensis]
MTSQGPTEGSHGIRGHFHRHRAAAAAAAAEYCRAERLQERLEEALNSAYLLRPDDVLGYLANYLAQFSKPLRISGLRGRKVLDGTGRATLEVEVQCTVRNNDQTICSTVISSDAPPPTCDTIEAAKESLMEVETAIQWIQETIGPLLRGIQPDQQSRIDQLLSEFIHPKIEEEKRRRDAERVAAMALPTGVDPTPPASPPVSKKKGSGKGKKVAVTEKPIPPAEPLEPVVQGSLAVGAVSLAIATSSAMLQRLPLYSHIAALRHGQVPDKLRLPIPLITLLSCGKASPWKLHLMKEVMMIPPLGLSTQQSVDLALSLQMQIMKHNDGAGKSAPVIRSESALGCPVLGGDRLEQPLELIGEACARLGLELGRDVYLAINCAAQELMDYNKSKYEILSGTWKSPDEMVAVYTDFISRHPAIMMLVDPLRREDRPQWEMLGKAIGSKCYLLEEVASKSISKLIQESVTTALPPPQHVTPSLHLQQNCATHTPPPQQNGVSRTQQDVTSASSGVVLKHTNQTTISDLVAAVKLIEGDRRVAVLGCTQEESSGDSVVDLAVGLSVQVIKLGGLVRGERTMKYNRLLAIAEELERHNQLGGKAM